MKKFLLLTVLMLCGFSAFAEEDEYLPTTTWPYVYQDFSAGYVTLTDGSVKTLLVNVNLVRETLHFIDGEMIRETFDIVLVKIGEDLWVNAGGRVRKVLASNENGFIVEGIDVDYATLNSTGGAYGSSSTTLGTMALTSLEGIGATNSSSSLNHMELKASRNNGQILPLIKKKYIFTEGKCIFATRKDVSEEVGADAVKTFLKTVKVKWNSPESLLQLLPLLKK
jgi:hypothetical protein